MPTSLWTCTVYVHVIHLVFVVDTLPHHPVYSVPYTMVLLFSALLGHIHEQDKPVLPGCVRWLSSAVQVDKVITELSCHSAVLSWIRIMYPLLSWIHVHCMCYVWFLSLPPPLRVDPEIHACTCIVEKPGVGRTDLMNNYCWCQVLLNFSIKF